MEGSIEESGEGDCAFAFGGQGLLVSPDSEDNPDNHMVNHSDAGNSVSFEVVNTGSSDCVAEVDIFVDDEFVTTWTSGTVGAGQSEAPEVHGIGRFPAGEHVFRAVVRPGLADSDDITNTINIE